MTVTPSAAETLKATSRHLRGPLAAELADTGTDRFSADAAQVLKFHGIYAQDDRDQRRERKRQGLDLAYSCMVRCSVPGGVLRRSQWLTIDALADQIGDGSLRLTTRQGVQYHFVHKGDVRELVAALNEGLVTTYAACGDVVRNIMATTAPTPERDLPRIESVTRSLVGRLRPRSAAYWELWLDGERAVSAGPASAPVEGVEPIYGDTYLPRKFKIGVAWPGDHSIDVHSQDLGLVLVPGADGRDGAVFLAGGGLGRSHTDDSTFPWLAEPLAWVPDEEIGQVAEAVVTTFRDHGNRSDRSHARLKYLVAERGIGWLRAEVEERIGRPLTPPVDLPPWSSRTRSFGWQRQRDGLDGEPRWFLHLPIPSGRLVDDERSRPRAALRAVLETLADEIRITPHQDVLICGVRPGDQAAVDAILAEHGVRQARELSLTVLSTMACPALPTCGQALGEAERVLPEVTDLIDGLLADRGLDDLAIETRMTGCPNGCARPYVAELGIVGRTKTAYDLWVGGDPAGTRLARPLIESVPLAKLDDVLATVLDQFVQQRTAGEGFGTWADRLGPTVIARDLPDFARPRRGAVR